MQSYFLPVGLLLAFAISWFAPGPGQELQDWGLIPWMVVIIFLVNGYQTQLSQMPLTGKLWRITLAAIAINLILSPFLGQLITQVLPLPTAATVGLIVMATVPSTLSSGIVITQLAKGDGLVSLFLTILLNLLGVFTIPFILPVVLGNIGQIELSPWPILQKLVLIVLIPFSIGMLARRVVQRAPRHWSIRYLPSFCVILTVWMSVSASTDTLKEISLPLIAAITFGSLLLHGSLLLLCLCYKTAVNTQRGEWLALLFTASQKTLPVAIGVLTAINQPLSLALVACIIFHFFQLLFDSMLASRLARNET